MQQQIDADPAKEDDAVQQRLALRHLSEVGLLFKHAVFVGISLGVAPRATVRRLGAHK